MKYALAFDVLSSKHLRGAIVSTASVWVMNDDKLAPLPYRFHSTFLLVSALRSDFILSPQASYRTRAHLWYA